MSTRQRRLGADGGGLSRATLHLLDVSRLRKELQQRGLDTKGSKVVLASRLEEAVWPEDFTSALPPQANDMPTPSTQKKGLKRKADQAFEEANEENAEPLAPIHAVTKVTRRSMKFEQGDHVAATLTPVKEEDQPSVLNTTPFAPFRFVWATEAPVKALQKADPSLLPQQLSAPIQSSTPSEKAASKDSDLKSASSKEPSPKPSSKDKESSPKTKEPSAKSPNKEKESSPKAKEPTPKAIEYTPMSNEPTSKPKKKAEDVSKPPKMKNNEEKRASIPKPVGEVKPKVKTCTPKAPSAPPQPSQPNSASNPLKKVEKNKIEKIHREASIEILETEQKLPKEAKLNVKIPSSKTPLPEVKQSKEARKLQSPIPLTIKTTSKPLTVDVTSPLDTPKQEQPSWSKSSTSVQPSSTPSPSPGPRPIVSKKTVLNNNSSSTDSIEPSTPGLGLKKKSIPLLPKKVTGGIDLLDNIIARQDVLLADKYKSEQEKALEKQRFELEKRKMSGAQSFGPLELERRLKKTASANSDPITSPPFEPLSPPSETVIDVEEMEEGISLPRPSVRDPLGLNIMEPIVNVVPPPSPSNPVVQRRFDSQPTTFSLPNFTSANSLLKAPPPPPPPPPPRLPPPPPPTSRPPPDIQIQLPRPALISQPPPPPPKITAPLPVAEPQQQQLPPRRRRLDVMKPLSPRHGQITSPTVYTDAVLPGLITNLPKVIQPPSSATNTLEEGEIGEEEEDAELSPPQVHFTHQPKPKFLENSFTQISSDSTIIVKNDAESEVAITEEHQQENLVAEEEEEEAEIETEMEVEESTMSDSRSVLSEMVSSIVEQEEQHVVEKKPLQRTVTFDTDEEEEVEGEEGMSSDGDSDGWSTEDDEEEVEESSEIARKKVPKVSAKEEPLQDNRVSETVMFDEQQQQQEVQTTVGLSIACEIDTYCDEPESEQQEIKPLEFANSSPQKNADGILKLLKDPKALLKRASDVLKKINESEVEKQELQIEYEQIDLDPEYTIEEEVKPLPDFHGEPVPDDDDDDDALFEIAAGISRPKKKDTIPVVAEEPLPDDDFIELDYYNADMNIKASASNKWLIEPDNGDGFALMWGGVRSNYGIAISEDLLLPAGKVAFQIKIVEFLSLKHVPFEELEPHDVRIGWSIAGSSNMLGESPHSYAFGSLGKKAQSNVFSAYGDAFHVDDIITSVMDLEQHEIRYYKNGINLGVAFDEVQFNSGDAIFPHVSTKNCKVLVNFRSGGEELPDNENKALWSLPPEENDAVMMGSLDYRKGMVASRRPPPDKTHCTVIMMVGLPGAGKSTWVRQYLREHPAEHWLLLNTDTILSAMTVNGIPRRRVHQGRWDMVMGLTAKALNRSLQMACRRRHNYIIDQSNVSREARRRKLTQFVDFQRKCVVLIPSDEELDKRLIKQSRQEGGAGQIPAEAMLELKAMFSIPCTETEPIEDVLFVEPPISRVNEAIELIKKYNEEAKPWIRKPYGRTQKPESTISDNRDIPNQWLSGRPSM